MAIPAGSLSTAIDGSHPGTMKATWTDPTGTVWDLSEIAPEVGWFTTPQIAGWGATHYTITTDKLPRGGVNIRSTRAEEARLTWPLHIYGDTHMEWLTRYRQLKRAFMMTAHRNKLGTLTVTRPDGSARQIQCMYEDGFAGEHGENWTFANPVLTLMCPDGYWRDANPLRIPRSFQVGTSFLSGYPQVSAGAVLGASTVDNPGDVTAWPTWTLTGPADVLTATNNTTGQSFILTKTIAAGQMITITTDRPTVRGPAGENLVSSLNWPDATMWGLVPGTNSVNFAVSGAALGTAIELAFYPRYEGA